MGSRLLVCMAVCALCSLVLADASLGQVDLVAKAQNTWFYGYYGQLGDRGFFGRFNVDASSTPPAFANVNGWVGNRTPDIGQTVSGSNAAVTSTSVEINPSLGSDWVTFKGKYTITVYDANTTQGAYVAMSPGQLTAWSLDVHAPVASFGWGKREFGRGIGLQFAPARTIELLFMERSLPVPDLLGTLVCRGVLPKGVLSWFNPDTWQRVSPAPKPDPISACPEDQPAADPPEQDVDSPCGPTTNPPYAQGWYGPGELTLGFGVMPWEQINPLGPGTTWSPKDVSGAQVRNLLGYVMYTSSNLELGIGLLRLFSHAGPELVDNTVVAEGVPPAQSNFLRFYVPTQETGITEGWLYLKFNNGRFFVLTELDWFNSVVRFQGSTYPQIFDQNTKALVPVIVADGSGRSRLAPQYIESWRYAAEVGAFLGPSSLRLFYSFLPGPDMRHGILIDRQSFINDTKRAGYGVFGPYSLLLGYFYGGGVNSQGDINGAAAFGAKQDYAVAANLFVSGTVLKALRSSDGFGWGHIRPNTASFGQVEYGNYRNPAIPGGQPTFNPALPTILDRDLGWEFTAGATWQLIEGWTFDARVAYWKPGKWFSYACIDRSVPNWDLPTAANNWGVNPNRDIDPVAGFEIRLAAKY
jgi:hypothetical protein